MPEVTRPYRFVFSNYASQYFPETLLNSWKDWQHEAVCRAALPGVGAREQKERVRMRGRGRVPGQAGCPDV